MARRYPIVTARKENVDEEGALTWLEGSLASEGTLMASALVRLCFVGREEEAKL